MPRTLDLRPVRLVLEASGGRSVDLHPVTFDATGFGRQVGDEGRVYEYPADGFGRGSIGGRTVPCLTAEQLVQFHLGYEPLEHDHQDMALLRDRTWASRSRRRIEGSARRHRRVEDRLENRIAAGEIVGGRELGVDLRARS